MRMYREAEAEGRAQGRAKGKAEGRAEGRAEGKAEILHEQLTTKFGSLPQWAAGRVSKATPTQIERWARKILVADTLEGVLGSRHRNGS
jgi:flagellar biosynthesis/type III secretory pathway protein FliH